MHLFYLCNDCSLCICLCLLHGKLIRTAVLSPTSCASYMGFLSVACCLISRGELAYKNVRLVSYVYGFPRRREGYDHI